MRIYPALSSHSIEVKGRKGRGLTQLCGHQSMLRISMEMRIFISYTTQKEHIKIAQKHKSDKITVRMEDEPLPTITSYMRNIKLAKVKGHNVFLLNWPIQLLLSYASYHCNLHHKIIIIYIRIHKLHTTYSDSEWFNTHKINALQACKYSIFRV